MHRARPDGPTPSSDPDPLPVNAPTPVGGQVRLVPADPAWPGLFAREAVRIRAALRERALQIEHIGSTSVPGLIAKPIIDILLVVADCADEASYLPDLEAAGYRLRIREPDPAVGATFTGDEPHRVCKGSDTDLNLHIYSAGSGEIERYLLMRDRLRTVPSERDLYARVKAELAAHHWATVQAYADAKNAVVEAIIGRAREAAS
ncbi:MAG: GrpB family protein [Chloroflexota bacterium]|nr:GrpB family protein [Chloroflexota bacterium]